MPVFSARWGLVGLIAVCGGSACLAAEPVQTEETATRWKQHDIHRPTPPVVEPAESPIAARPPRDAVVLFDGSNLDAWQTPEGRPAGWKVVEGCLETVPGTGPIQTKQTFGDLQLHVEWAAPDPPHGRSQDRGNSGVYLMGAFEIQVLDSYQSETYADGQAGAIYGQYPPLVNASRPPGAWQSYDIAFRRPRFADSGQLLEPARITVFQNGILVQNNEEPFGPTSWLKWLPYEDQGGRGPILLQDHDHPVRYRNLWVRDLPDRPAPSARDLAQPETNALPAEVLDSCAGSYGRISDQSNHPFATIAREEGHLTIAFPFRPQPLELLPISETEFNLPFTDGRLTFHRDDRGHVTGFRLRVGDSEQEMKKSEP